MKREKRTLKNWRDMTVAELEEEEKMILGLGAVDKDKSQDEKKSKILRKSWLSLSLAEIIEISKATAEEVLRKEAVRAIVDIDVWTDETLQVVITPVFSDQRIEEQKEDRIARAISQSIVESLNPPKRPLVIWKQLSK
jgi:hypothetical protein